MSKKNKILLFIIIGLIILIISFYKINSNFNIEDIKSESRTFKEYVVFYPQHQDDEVLWGGSAVRKAVNTLGSNHVFVVLVSDGTGVNVFKGKTYKNKTRKEKEEIRNKEFYAALYDLGVKRENIIILADIDNKSGTHFELMKEIALNFENKYKNVTHVAHSYKYDDHRMHRSNGKVIYTLYKEKRIKDAMFYLKPKYVKKLPKEKLIFFKAENTDDCQAIINACNEYRIINEEKDRRGVGYISAHNYFDKLLNDPQLTSVLHLP